MQLVVDRMANGAQVLELCKELGIKYSDLLTYTNYDPVRSGMLSDAVRAGESWLVQRIAQELNAMGMVDIKDALNADGTVKPIHQIPETLRRAIAGIEVRETFDSEGVKTGEIKTIKLADKHKSLEMLAKKVGGFIEKVVVSGSVQVNHKVDDFDLEERIKALTERRTVKVPRATITDVAEEAVVIKEQRGGEDI